MSGLNYFGHGVPTPVFRPISYLLGQSHPLHDEGLPQVTCQIQSRTFHSSVMKMASKAAEVSPPSQSASSHDQQTARHLLRSHRSELLDRLTPSTIKRLADKLYELEIISYDEMEDIRRNRRPTLKMARQLVTVIETRSWAQCLKFISLLQKTEGIEDLGTKLLHETGET